MLGAFDMNGAFLATDQIGVAYQEQDTSKGTT